MNIEVIHTYDQLHKYIFIKKLLKRRKSRKKMEMQVGL